MLFDMKQAEIAESEKNVKNSKRAEAAKKNSKADRKTEETKKLRDPWSLKKKLVVIFMILIALFVAVPVCIAGIIFKKG